MIKSERIIEIIRNYALNIMYNNNSKTIIVKLTIYSLILLNTFYLLVIIFGLLPPEEFLIYYFTINPFVLFTLLYLILRDHYLITLHLLCLNFIFGILLLISFIEVSIILSLLNFLIIPILLYSIEYKFKGFLSSTATILALITYLLLFSHFESFEIITHITFLLMLIFFTGILVLLLNIVSDENQKINNILEEFDNRIAIILDKTNHPLILTSFDCKNIIQMNQPSYDLFNITAKTLNDLDLIKLLNFDNAMENKFQQMRNKASKFVLINDITTNGIKKTLEISVTKFDSNTLLFAINDLSKSKDLTDELDRSKSMLKERVKELTCLYNVLRHLYEDKGSLDDKIKQLTIIIPKGWQYPEICTCKITFNEKLFESENHVNTPWYQSVEIVSEGKQYGRIEVYYKLETSDPEHNLFNPFLVEEYELLKGIARSLANYINYEQSKIQLEEKDRYILQAQKMEALGRLTGGIAHDFNNILGGVKGYTELVIELYNPDNETLEALNQINNIVEKGKKLTEQLLSLTKLQSQPTIFNPNDLINDMYFLLDRITGSNINLSFNLKDDLPSIKMEPTKFEQIILNLVINAKEAISDSGYIVIETSLNEELKYIKISVEDTGKGIPVEYQKKIFEPFFTTKSEGSGLGLSIVLSIVDQYNGLIDLGSVSGEGTKLTIYLPYILESENRSIASEKISVTSQLIQVYQGNETILVVEDNESLRSVIMKYLDYLGYNALEANNGWKGLKLIENLYREFDEKKNNKQIDLIISDVLMPEMDGHSMYRKILEKNWNIPIIFISGYLHKEHIIESIIEHNHIILYKPFELTELLQQVRKILDGTAYNEDKEK
jgi:signal transduction histidine kinase/CheY-like chemotaxis protein